MVLFVETPHKFITAKLSICKPGSSSVLIICDLFNSHALFIYESVVICWLGEKPGVYWFTLVKPVEISQYVLRNIRRIARKLSKINLLWLNTLGLRPKWDEATILAIDSHKFSRNMRESIEIEKNNTIDQEGKTLDVQN